MPRLEKWGMVRDDGNPYQAPETRSWSLTGQVYDSPKFVDGHRILTSSLFQLTIDGDVITAKTRSGTLYVLGQPDPEYVKVLEASGQTMAQSLEKMKKIAESQNHIQWMTLN